MGNAPAKTKKLSAPEFIDDSAVAPRILVGPVVGRVTCHSARLLWESSVPVDVRCRMTRLAYPLAYLTNLAGDSVRGVGRRGWCS